MKDCTVHSLYSYFASKDQLNEFTEEYKQGIGWGDAKNKLFEIVNEELEPIRHKYESLSEDKDLINDLLSDGASKVRIQAKDMILSLRESIGIQKIS